MFDSQVAEYNDDDLIGTDATTAQSNFDRSHVLYRAIARLADVTREHRALRDGAHQHRYAADGAGHLRVLAARARRPARVRRRAEQRRVRADGGDPDVDRLGHVHARLRRRRADAAQRRRQAPAGHRAAAVDGRLPLGAADPDEPGGAVDRDRRARRGRLGPRPARGPRRRRRRLVLRGDVRGPGRRWRLAGRSGPTTTRPTASSTTSRGSRRGRRSSTARPCSTTTATSARAPSATPSVAPPALTLEAPREDGRVRGAVEVRATATPELAHYVVRFERQVDGGAWTPVGIRRLVAGLHGVRRHDRAAGRRAGDLPRDPDLRRRPTVTSDNTRTVTVVSTPVTQVTIHYKRTTDTNYADWGLHLFGDALAPGEATAEWTNATPFEGTDALRRLPRHRDRRGHRAGRLHRPRQAAGATRTSRTPTPTASSSRWSARTSS